MAVEPEPRRLPIGALTALVPVAEAFPVAFAEKERVTSVGGIFFQEGKRMVLLGEGSNGNLHTQYLDTPEGFTLASIVEGRGRFLDLGRYHEVLVAQVGIADQSIRAHHSVRTMPSVSLRLEYTDAETQEQGIYVTDEETVLRVFAGEAGGIALFEGMGRPEEVALVLDREHEGARVAVAFIMHPKESDLIDSVVGFSDFLRLLNEQFTAQSQFALQSQVLSELERENQRGILVFDSSVREQLYTAIVIANARLAHRTGQERYRTFLREHFSGMGRGLRLFGNPGRDQRMRQVNQAIDALILGNTVHKDVSRSSVEVVFDGKKIFYELRQVMESKTALQVLDAEFMSNLGYDEDSFGIDTTRMRDFIKRFLLFISRASYSEHLRDAEAMLATVMNTPFAGSAVVDYDLLTSNGEKGPQLIFYNNPGDTMSSPSRRFNSNPARGQVLITELLHLLNERKSAFSQRG